jgi:hypothetical protein
MIHTLIPPTSKLATALKDLGVKEPVTVVLSSEDDGLALEKAIRAQTKIEFDHYDPKIAEVRRTATIADVKFVWPSANPNEGRAHEEV